MFTEYLPFANWWFWALPVVVIFVYMLFFARAARQDAEHFDLMEEIKADRRRELEALPPEELERMAAELERRKKIERIIKSEL